MLSRTPERRKANRSNSAGRRIHRRFILESEIVVGVSLVGNLFSAANILDISMSGAYILVGGIGKPEIDQIINISFSEAQFVYPTIVQSKIKYINDSSLIGNELYGMGIEFMETLPIDFLDEISSSKLIVAGTKVSVNSYY